MWIFFTLEELLDKARSMFLLFYFIIMIKSLTANIGKPIKQLSLKMGVHNINSNISKDIGLRLLKPSHIKPTLLP